MADDGDVFGADALLREDTEVMITALLHNEVGPRREVLPQPFFGLRGGCSPSHYSSDLLLELLRRQIIRILHGFCVLWVERN